MELDYLLQVLQEGPRCCFVREYCFVLKIDVYIIFVDELPRANGSSHV